MIINLDSGNQDQVLSGELKNIKIQDEALIRVSRNSGIYRQCNK